MSTAHNQIHLYPDSLHPFPYRVRAAAGPLLQYHYRSLVSSSFESLRLMMMTMCID